MRNWPCRPVGLRSSNRLCMIPPRTSKPWRKARLLLNKGWLVLSKQYRLPHPVCWIRWPVCLAICNRPWQIGWINLKPGMTMMRPRDKGSRDYLGRQSQNCSSQPGLLWRFSTSSCGYCSVFFRHFGADLIMQVVFSPIFPSFGHSKWRCTKNMQSSTILSMVVAKFIIPECVIVPDGAEVSRVAWQSTHLQEIINSIDLWIQKKLGQFLVPQVTTYAGLDSYWSHVLDRWCISGMFRSVLDVAFSTIGLGTEWHSTFVQCCPWKPNGVIKRFWNSFSCEVSKGIFTLIRSIKFCLCSVLWLLSHFWPSAFLCRMMFLCCLQPHVRNTVNGSWYFVLCHSCQVQPVTVQIKRMASELTSIYGHLPHGCKKQSRRKWRGGICAADFFHELSRFGCDVATSVITFFLSFCKMVRILLSEFRISSFVIMFAFWVLLIFTSSPRIGEASNPGPVGFHNDFKGEGVDADFLWVGSCNPTQLFSKEDVFPEWGNGIWAVSETSTTAQAMPIIRSRLKTSGFNVQFGDPVLPQQASSNLRGKAGGVAVVTNFPVRRYQYPSPDYLYKSTRFVDTIVQVRNDLAILVCSLYGVAGLSSSHSMSLTHDIFAQAANRVSKYSGPSIICGDLNVDLEQIESWRSLQELGWKDMALLDSEKYCREPQPTSVFGHRHTFIIASPELCRCFHACRTVETHDFDAHPLLVSGFKIESYMQHILQWKLPKSFDDVMFDDELLESNAELVCAQRSSTFEASLHCHDMDQAARQFTLAFEETLRNSSVTVDGHVQRIPHGHFGRSKGNPFTFKKARVVCIKPGRNGDFTPILTQTNCSLRSHTKQLRRLQALRQQYNAAIQHQSEKGYRSCQALWNSILSAHGFTRGFSSWIGAELGSFVPLCLPSIEYVEFLTSFFEGWHKRELNHFFLQKNADRRLKIEADIAKGGKWCFDQVKDTNAPPLASISWTVKCKIKKVAWKKQGLSNIPLNEKSPFDSNFPVIFQGQERNIVHQSDNHLILDKPVALKSMTDMIISQTKTSADMQDIHHQLHESWEELWCRDVGRQDNQQWDQACNLISSLSDCPSCPFKPLTEELWTASLRGAKPRSARGADGFSTRDCKMMRGPILRWLLQILQKVEAGHNWPSQWCIAKITVLSKGHDSKSPLDIRPISILAKIYRMWSRLRSMEVLQHIGKQLPPQVAATAGGVSADILAAYTANEIEHSLCSKDWICGLIVDLVKCYNLVPWFPCEEICRKLGIPQAYVLAMFGHLRQLKRSFEVQGACSPFITAKNGIAEGCTMSVALMTALSWFVHKCVEQYTQRAYAICYADNWGLVAKSPEDLVPATKHLEHVVEALRMRISIEKSWTWTTNPAWKSRLHNVHLHQHRVAIRSSVVDLGCDQTYHRKKVITTQKKRLSKAKRVLKRITKLKTPQKFRTTMVQACGFGAFAFGTEIVGVSNWTWKSLRASVASGLGKGGACASAYLSCLFHSTPVDPQLRHIIRTALFWRRFFSLFPSKQQGFLDRLSSKNKIKGPAMFFREALERIGWNVLSNGSLQHEKGFHFDWVRCSRSFLRKTFRTFWSFYASKMSQHRKDFSLDSFDEVNISRSLAKRSPKDRSLLLTHFTGKACTNSGFAKFNTAISPMCENCQMPDTREHRLLVCPLFKASRVGAGQILQWAKSQGPTTTNLGLVSLDVSPMIRLSKHAIPWVQLPCPEICHVTRTIFTDGSAYWQDQFTLALAGIAAIECTQESYEHKQLFSEPLPGIDMNSYRAEAYAILKTMSKVSKTMIYSDCQQALNHLWYLCECHKNEICPKFQDHQDIWGQIWIQIKQRPPGWIDAKKTAAHVSLSSCSSSQQRWEAWMNNQVDVLAKEAVQKWRPMFHKNEQCFNQLNSKFKKLRALHDVIIGQATQTKPVDFKHVTPENQKDEFQDKIPVLAICSPYPISGVPDDCPFTMTFLNRVVDWASKLQWPSPSLGEVSALELYIDFTLYTKTFAPVKIGDGFALKDQCRNAEVIYQTLAQQSWNWNLFLRWMRRINCLLWPGQYIQRSTALKDMGFTLWTPAISNHPRFTQGDLVYKVIKKLFVTKTGKIRNFNVAYHGPQMVLWASVVRRLCFACCRFVVWFFLGLSGGTVHAWRRHVSRSRDTKAKV